MSLLRIVVMAAACVAPGIAFAQSPEPTWRLVSVGGAPAEGEGEIGFGPDGAVFGSTGCNRFTGAGVFEGGALTIPGPMAGTRMACPEPLMVQETKVYEALSGTSALVYDPFSDSLTLTPASGAAELRFERKAD